MARKIRIEYAGAAYHVMARGNQGRAIYADERDRKLWLATLGEACEKTGWRIHASPAQRQVQAGAQKPISYQFSDTYWDRLSDEFLKRLKALGAELKQRQEKKGEQSATASAGSADTPPASVS